MLPGTAAALPGQVWAEGVSQSCRNALVGLAPSLAGHTAPREAGTRAGLLGWALSTRPKSFTSKSTSKTDAETL